METNSKSGIFGNCKRTSLLARFLMRQSNITDAILLCIFDRFWKSVQLEQKMWHFASSLSSASSQHRIMSAVSGSNWLNPVYIHTQVLTGALEIFGRASSFLFQTFPNRLTTSESVFGMEVMPLIAKNVTYSTGV